MNRPLSTRPDPTLVPTGLLVPIVLMLLYLAWSQFWSPFTNVNKTPVNKDWPFKRFIEYFEIMKRKGPLQYYAIYKCRLVLLDKRKSLH